MTNDWHTYVRTVLARHTSSPDEDVVEELAQHAMQAFEAARAEGLSAAEAEADVRRDVDRWCSERRVQARRPRRPAAAVPPPGTAHGLTGLGQDLRFGLRLLRREPGFTALAVLTAALGVGATTTLASVAYGVLLRPLPFDQADRVVRVVETRADTTRLLPPIMSNGPYHAWLSTPPGTIDGLAAFSAQVSSFNLPGAEATRVRGLAATASLFAVLPSRPLHGGYYTGDNETEGNQRVIVLSHGLWTERFGGDPDVIGQTVTLDGTAHTILGVAPPDFAFPDRDHRYWVPLVVPPASENGVSMFGAIARLKPGATPEQAAAEATARARSGPQLGLVGIAVFGTKSAPVVNAIPLADFLAGDVRPAMLMLLGAVALLFGTAVANVSSMQLARAATRRRELAIRAAIGAGGGRIARQLVVEGSLLGLAGGLAGIGVAIGLHAILPTVLPATFPRITDIHLDAALMGGALALGLLGGLGFGLLPALQARRLDLVSGLTDDGQAPVGVGMRSASGALRSGAMAAQVAAATLLLVGAGLLGRSFSARWSMDRGYQPADVLTARLVMPNYAFTGVTRARAIEDVLARLATQPGVRHAAFTTVMPLMPYEALMGFQMRDAGGAAVEAQAAVRTVSPDYLNALGSRLHAGRWLRADDSSSSTLVVVVNRAFVRAYLSGDGLGSRLPVDLAANGNEWEVVGVVEDIQPRVGGEPPRPEIFVSFHQRPSGVGFEEPIVVLRTSGDAAALGPAVRRIAADVHPAIAVESIMTMEDRLESGLAEPRLYSWLVAAFAALSVAIAAAGLFGVVSYNVARRTRELGVRAALGATPGRLVRLVLRQGLAITAAGIGIGLAGAAAGASLLSSLIYGIRPRDPWTFTVVPLVLFALATVACLAPALRAARIDPLKALNRSSG